MSELVVVVVVALVENDLCRRVPTTPRVLWIQPPPPRTRDMIMMMMMDDAVVGGGWSSV